MNGPSPADRIRQTGRLLRHEGTGGVSRRLRKRMAEALEPSYMGLPVSRENLRRASEVAAAGWVLPPPLPAEPGAPLTIAWVLEPPSHGSGGATTIFRIVASLERAGHTCVLYMADRHGWSIDQHRRTIRTGWPRVGAEVRDLAEGIEDSHVVFATDWRTAYPVLASPARGRRCYFVQDFEPLFYPAGSEALLAEATYRFGFHGVTAGRWLAEKLRDEYAMDAGHFDFGCDVRYELDPAAGERAGICYFCRPSAPRRAHELALATLDLFAERHPEIEIHLYGQRAGALPFRATDHGLCTPEQLGELYNRCIAGLVLSATNVSLVPHEMLAAGCIPVVNDAEHNRIVLDNDHVAYAPGTPFELAARLCELVERPAAERAALAETAAASMISTSWEAAGLQVDHILRGVIGSRSEHALAA